MIADAIATYGTPRSRLRRSTARERDDSIREFVLRTTAASAVPELLEDDAVAAVVASILRRDTP
jgi:hypothetical protein